jgi:hypothetical protein
VQAGNRTASQYAQPRLWAWLDARPRTQWPRLLRGDISWGTGRMMQEAEQRERLYLFKLKKTANVNRHIEKLWGRQDWVDAGAGWQGLRSELQLTDWSRPRSVVILRRPLREALAVSGTKCRPASASSAAWPNSGAARKSGSNTRRFNSRGPQIYAGCFPDGSTEIRSPFTVLNSRRGP